MKLAPNIGLANRQETDRSFIRSPNDAHPRNDGDNDGERISDSQTADNFLPASSCRPNKWLYDNLDARMRRFGLNVVLGATLQKLVLTSHNVMYL